MAANLDYRWRLREFMASRSIFSTAALGALLAERGVKLSPSQVYRLVADKPVRLNLHTLMALMDVLDCQMSDLIEPIGPYGGAVPEGGLARARHRQQASGSCPACRRRGIVCSAASS